jgi:hypothetical protein
MLSPDDRSRTVGIGRPTAPAARAVTVPKQRIPGSQVWDSGIRLGSPAALSWKHYSFFIVGLQIYLICIPTFLSNDVSIMLRLEISIHNVV